MSFETALSALKSLSPERNIKEKLSTSSMMPLSLLICIDNVDFDFEERIHFKSVKNTINMFHGTWGYIHTLNKSLLQSSSPEKISFQKYEGAIHKSENPFFVASILFHWLGLCLINNQGYNGNQNTIPTKLKFQSALEIILNIVDLCNDRFFLAKMPAGMLLLCILHSCKTSWLIEAGNSMKARILGDC